MKRNFIVFYKEDVFGKKYCLQEINSKYPEGISGPSIQDSTKELGMVVKEILEETRTKSESKLYEIALYNGRPKISSQDKTYLYGEHPDITINHEGIHVLRSLSIKEFDQLLEEIKNYKK